MESRLITLAEKASGRNVDVADAACFGELWPFMPSVRTVSQQSSCVGFVQRIPAHTRPQDFLKKGVLYAVLLLGSLTHLVLNRFVCFNGIYLSIYLPIFLSLSLYIYIYVSLSLYIYIYIFRES